MITAENIFKHELIGLNARVISSSNPKIIGLNGTIVDETKSMLTIETSNGMKKIPKNINNWEFSSKEQSFQIDGSKIAKRSHERLEIKA